MIEWARRVAAAVGLSAYAAASWAGPVLQLNATSTLPSLFSDFTVTFNDADMDSQLDFGEILSFSGVNIAASGQNFLYPTITSLPDTSFTDAGGSCFVSNSFCFTNGSAVVSIGQSGYTETITSVSSVPEPGTLALAAVALLSAGLVRRKRA